jgi:branched-chain amino acid transport system permease protein
MNLFIGLTIGGLATASIYAIAASGLVVTYTTSGVFNVAHGAIGMLMAFLYWQLRVQDHWAAPFALFVVLFVVAPILGATIQAIVISRVNVHETGVLLVITIALLVLAMGVAYTFWPPTVGREVLPFFGPDAHILLFGRRIPYEELISIGLALAVAIGLRLFLYRSRVGVLMRGVVDDRSLISLNGVRPSRLNMLSWAIGASLAGLAGILQATQIDDLVVLDLTFLVVNSFAAAMLGRLRSLPLTFAGAMVLGLADSYAGGYIHSTSGILEELRPALPTLFLVIVLLALPSVRLRVGAPPTRRPPRTATFPVSVVQALVTVAAVIVSAYLFHGTTLAALEVGMSVAIAGLAVVLLSGYGGQINLALYSVIGFASWMFAKTATHGQLWGVFLVVLAGAAIGTVIAVPSLRLRGLELALSTLAIAELAYFTFFDQTSVMGLGNLNVPRLQIPFISIASDRADLVFLGVVFALLALGLSALRRSNFGRLLAAIRDSPAACSTLGQNLVVTKLVLAALGGGLAAFAGVLYGSTNLVVTGQDFSYYQGLFLVLIVFVWGVNTPYGALLGGISLSVVPLITPHLPERFQELTYLATGLAALSIALNPNGLLDTIGNEWRKRGRQVAKALPTLALSPSFRAGAGPVLDADGL